MTDIDKSKIMVDGRYLFTMDDGRTLKRRGTFLMACDDRQGWHLNEERLAHIVKIEEEGDSVNCWSCRHIVLDIEKGYICRVSGKVIAKRLDRYEINRPTDCKDWKAENDID